MGPDSGARAGTESTRVRWYLRRLMAAVPIAIFVLTYVLIANRQLRWLPIGRAAGAMLGAVLMVLCGVLVPRAAYLAIDPATLALLFGMMVITVFLVDARALEWSGVALLRRLRTPTTLLVAVSMLSGVLSAFLVNDTICLFATPIVVLACQRARLPLLPYLMAVATSSNVGSIGTLVGNPQIMIIGSMSQIPFSNYLARMGPIALALLVVNAVLLVIFYGRSLPKRFGAVELDPILIDPRRVAVVCVVLCGVFIAFLRGADLSWVAMAGAVALIITSRADPAPVFARVDWKLLVFFAGLFVVVKGVDSTGLSRTLVEHLRGTPWYVPALLVGSNLFSNVPLVLLAGPHMVTDGDWFELALVSTLAGNLTLVGSAANLIVAEQAELPFWAHLRFGVISTIVTTVIGLLLIAT